MGIEYGLGKKHDGFTFTGSSAYQDIVINISPLAPPTPA